MRISHFLATVYLRFVGWRAGRRIAGMVRDPMRMQRAVLAKILADNRATQFGRAHHFANIDGCVEFSKCVPVSEFENLRPFVDAQIQRGETALTMEAPLAYMRTSGTTGQPKDLPLVRSHLVALRRIHRTAVAYQYRSCPAGFAGSILALTGAAQEGILSNGKPYGSASGMVSRNTTRSVLGKFVLPHAVLSVADSHLKYLLVLRLALARKDISYIGTANPSTLLALMKVYRLNSTELIADLRRGGFFRAADLSAELAQAIRPYLAPQPARAEELMRLHAAGANVRIADLWPQLRLIVTWTCGSAGVAVASLRQELLPQTRVLELGYIASEFRGAITLGRFSGSGLPTLDTHFFEFVEPEKWDAGAPEFLTLDEIRKGMEYYLIVTTPSGLYRYFINDLVRVTGFLHRTPLLKFVQKGKGVTNITGEKLYESQVLAAARAALTELNHSAHFLMMLADEDSARYCLYVETESGNSMDAGVLSSLVDQKLARLNLEYRSKRESGRLRPVAAYRLKPGVADAYKLHCVAGGQREGQFKTVSLAYLKSFSFDFAPYMESQTTLESIAASVLAIPFNVAFKHASAERMQTQALWVESRTQDGHTGYGEGCPREYVSNESLDSAMAFVGAHRDDWLAGINGMTTLRAWVAAHRLEIDANPAAWTAVELSLLDALGKAQRCSVESLLGLPELGGEFYYTAVLGDASPANFQAQLGRYQQMGFTRFKIKLSGVPEQDRSKIEAIQAAGIAAAAVRADANNLWGDAETAIAHMRALNFHFMGLEEPLQGGDVATLRRIAESLDMKIILDESLLRLAQLAAFAENPEYWIVNLRISKMGGVLRSLAMLQEIRKAGLGLIIGAHVGETSVLTRAALIVAGTARDILIAQEGAFGTHLLEKDVVEKPLMFGRGGRLCVEGSPGWGLQAGA